MTLPVISGNIWYYDMFYNLMVKLIMPLSFLVPVCNWRMCNWLGVPSHPALMLYENESGSSENICWKTRFKQKCCNIYKIDNEY